MHGGADELQAWTKAGGHQVNAKSCRTPRLFFLPCATCPEWTAILVVIGLRSAAAS
jgi:hypothetical protein